jgi:hypothetical protein
MRCKFKLPETRWRCDQESLSDKGFGPLDERLQRGMNDIACAKSCAKFFNFCSFLKNIS